MTCMLQGLVPYIPSVMESFQQSPILLPVRYQLSFLGVGRCPLSPTGLPTLFHNFRINSSLHLPVNIFLYDLAGLDLATGTDSGINGAQSRLFKFIYCFRNLGGLLYFSDSYKMNHSREQQLTRL